MRNESASISMTKMIMRRRGKLICSWIFCKLILVPVICSIQVDKDCKWIHRVTALKLHFAILLSSLESCCDKECLFFLGLKCTWIPEVGKTIFIFTRLWWNLWDGIATFFSLMLFFFHKTGACKRKFHMKASRKMGLWGSCLNAASR